MSVKQVPATLVGTLTVELPDAPPPVVNPPLPTHPIVIPPGAIAPGLPTHPIVLPPYLPTHPIVIPPGSLAPGVPTHPIVLPPPIPAHPIIIPPDAIAPGVPTHPIYLPPGIWGGSNEPFPTPPIFIPPNHPSIPPAPEGFTTMYMPSVGFVWVEDGHWFVVGAHVEHHEKK